MRVAEIETSRYSSDPERPSAKTKEKTLSDLEDKDTANPATRIKTLKDYMETRLQRMESAGKSAPLKY